MRVGGGIPASTWVLPPSEAIDCATTYMPSPCGQSECSCPRSPPSNTATPGLGRQAHWTAAASVGYLVVRSVSGLARQICTMSHMICAETMAWHHLTTGGPNQEPNLAISCNRHNQEQGQLRFHEFLQKLLGCPEPRPPHGRPCNPLFLTGKMVRGPLLEWLTDMCVPQCTPMHRGAQR